MSHLFDQAYEQIVDQILGSRNSYTFQMAYPFIDWSWETPNSGYINPTAYTYVSRIPKWSAIYCPTDRDLHSEYLSMLFRCPKLTLTSEQQVQVEEVDKRITKCHTKIQEDTEARNQAWQAATSNLPLGVPKPEWNKWVADNGWVSTLQSDRVALAKATETKLSIIAQENSQYSEVLAAAKPPNVGELKPGYVHCFVTPGQEEVRPNYLIGESGSDWIKELTRGVHFGMPVNIQLSSGKSSWAGKGTSPATCYSFISIYSDNEWKDLNLDKKDETVQVNIYIASVTQVPIVPDSAWYNSGYLKILATEERWNPPFTTANVFGKEGMIPLIVTGMIAGYKPSFEIKMSKKVFQQHKSKFKTCDDIRIGPFHFTRGVGSSSDSWTEDISSSTFSGKSTANYPFIMGFVVSKPV